MAAAALGAVQVAFGDTRDQMAHFGQPLPLHRHRVQQGLGIEREPRRRHAHRGRFLLMRQQEDQRDSRISRRFFQLSRRFVARPFGAGWAMVSSSKNLEGSPGGSAARR